MKNPWLFVLILATQFSPSGWAAGPLPLFLKPLTGCFRVAYNYTENGKVALPPYRETAHEWVTAREEGGTYRLQHYAIHTQDETTTTHKHWSSVWKELSPGIWRQLVLGPAGQPRYDCTAPVKQGKGGIFQRTCSAKNTPKPRRDAARDDYATLDRFHLLTITADVWIDTQHNHKITKEDEVLSQEFGWNEYSRVPEGECDLAITTYGR